MHPLTFPSLVLFITASTAFKVTTYDSVNCTGNYTKSLGNLKLDDGCRTLGDKDYHGSIKIEWAEEADNAVTFGMFWGDKCCVASFYDALIWQDECVELNRVKGIRVVDPSDLSKGKEGQNYTCVGDW